jgi:hypothetical protein
MLFTIDEAKVAELLRSSGGVAAASVYDLPIVVENCMPAPAYAITSEAANPIYAAPVLVTEETRERILAARREIERSGVPLKGVEALNREIDEMRRRD